jgi:hypothetical protein
VKLAVLFLALALQPPQPFEGTLAQGLKRVEELALSGKKAEALALAEELRAGRSSRVVAAVEYARGLVHAGAGERDPAAEAFQRARADGAGELRLAAMYNLGSLALQQGEEWYHKLPEVSGKPAAAAPAAAPAAGPGQAPEPDALAEARKSYLAARERFLERLRAQWDDADTRADVELVQRRLKRLDELEKQRKEEQQKQKQDSKDGKDKQPPQDQKQPPDPDAQKNDPQKQDKPEDKPPTPDPADKDKQPESQPEQPKPEEPKPGDAQEPQPKPAPQMQLSKEEMTRLLDKLQQLEEQAAKLRAQIHKARRQAVKKDW